MRRHAKVQRDKFGLHQADKFEQSTDHGRRKEARSENALSPRPHSHGATRELMGEETHQPYYLTQCLCAFRTGQHYLAVIALLYEQVNFKSRKSLLGVGAGPGRADASIVDRNFVTGRGAGRGAGRGLRRARRLGWEHCDLPLSGGGLWRVSENSGVGRLFQRKVVLLYMSKYLAVSLF